MFFAREATVSAGKNTILRDNNGYKQSQVKIFARIYIIESLCVFITGLYSLIKSISKPKQLHFDLHVFKYKIVRIPKQTSLAPLCACRLPVFLFTDRLVLMSSCVPDIVCVSQITLEFVNHKAYYLDLGDMFLFLTIGGFFSFGARTCPIVLKQVCSMDTNVGA